MNDASDDSNPWHIWCLPPKQVAPYWLHKVPFLAMARSTQRPPETRWRTWLLLGGRGAGKTRAGAEWLNFAMRYGACRRAAIVGTTLSEVRNVMIEGVSGLCAVDRLNREPSLQYMPTLRRITYPNGGIVQVFSAADPDSLRGPQFDVAWCDEVAAWPQAGRAWDILQMGLRIGAWPQIVATTTPRPTPLIKRIMAEAMTQVTRTPTADNAANLSPGFMEVMRARYGHSALARQELDAELVEDLSGAMFQWAWLERNRVTVPPDRFDETIVAIDPPTSISANADACGIVGAGRLHQDGFGERVFVLADATVQGVAPQSWAARSVALAAQLKANRIIAEANQGGEMIRSVLQGAGCQVPIDLVYARLDKRQRAAPVSVAYETGKVAHIGIFEALERDMVTFGTESQLGSPDRVDALVWAVWCLLREGTARLRWL